MEKRVFELVSKRAVENKTKFHTGGEAMERKGFTLIELMIVIAIIIILAAVAIPNYLKMTDRAKRSRIAGDFESLATALEAYKTDWGFYPTEDVTVGYSYTIGKNNNSDSLVETELAGTSAAGTGRNNADHNTTSTGEQSPIEYIKLATLNSMVNPFFPNEDYYYYVSKSGNHWLLAAHIPDHKVGADTYVSVYRTDSVTQLTESKSAAANLTIDENGAVSP